MDEAKQILASVDLVALAYAAVIVAAIFFSVLFAIAAWPRVRSMLCEQGETLSSGRFMFIVWGLTISICLIYTTLKNGTISDLPALLGVMLLALYGIIKGPELLAIIRGRLGPEEPPK